MKKTDYENLEKSLYRLKEQYENFLNSDKQNLSEINKEAIKESVIQRFESCYDSLWKSLKKYLQEDGFSFDKSTSPRVIFRKAHEACLIDKEDLESFFDYVDLRIGTSHDYSSVKAEKALKKMGEFIQDVSHIYNQIVDRK